ncbi:MAG: PP2C family protein-serine/threonine phosphatase, partial [Rhodospirillales bacterium]|nr:PP2C family protein-serine/threonine phosphatase [Rhodospirillales bacterium]
LNARMAAALVEQERTRRELELAAEIQRSLLPPLPSEESPIQGINRAARTVSGDFYDFFTLGDGRICFAIGDVSGKGMDAALLMAKTCSLFHCLGKVQPEPGRLLAKINAEICETATRGRFVTMVIGVFDPADGTVRLSNAGHEPPLHYRGADGYVDFPATAAPLGIAADIVGEEGFPEETIELNGGALYLFTDGVTEGRLADGNTLEVEGLKEILAVTSGLSLAERLNVVSERFGSGGAELRDDVTIIGIEDRGRAT